eukprot:15258-Ditylum_brightwellii.AAC.1
MEMQQQDRFIFAKLIEQWEKSTIMEMKQWVTTNHRYIKYCLGVCLKQKLMHSADIRNYVEMKETAQKRVRLRGAKKKYKNKNKKKKDNWWKQKDIRGT